MSDDKDYGKFWQGKKVLITGATGFVGSHLAAQLHTLGARVTGADLRLSSVTWERMGLEGVPVYFRQIEDRDTLELGVLVRDAEIIFHLAGAVDVHWCTQHPVEAFKANVSTVNGVIQSIWRNSDKIAAAVFASSDRVYGDHKGELLTEKSNLLPVDVYGATKAAGDILAAQAARAGLPVARLRHVNSYGELDPHRKHLIPMAVDAVAAGRRPQIKSDGSPRKSYVHIEDVVQGYLVVGEALAQGKAHANGAFNLTGDDNFSVLEVVNHICAVAGFADGPEVLSTDLTQSGYVERLDGSKLKSFGWRQTVSIQDGIERMVAAAR